MYLPSWQVLTCMYTPRPDLKVLLRYIHWQVMYSVQTGVYIFLQCTYTLDASTYTDVHFSFQLFWFAQLAGL